jgi:hypothetical protein
MSTDNGILYEARIEMEKLWEADSSQYKLNGEAIINATGEMFIQFQHGENSIPPRMDELNSTSDSKPLVKFNRFFFVNCHSKIVLFFNYNSTDPTSP